MRTHLCLPGVPFGEREPSSRVITPGSIIVVVVVLAFAFGLLAVGVDPAAAVWVTGAVAATASVLARRLRR